MSGGGPTGEIRITASVEQPGATPSEATVVAETCRDGPLCASSFELNLAEAKGLLVAVRSQLIRAQLDAHVAAQRHGEHCGARRWTKDWRTARFRSLFGAIELRGPRLRRCACADPRAGARTVRIEGLHYWTAPELEYVHTRLGGGFPGDRGRVRTVVPVPYRPVVPRLTGRTSRSRERRQHYQHFGDFS